MAVGFGVITQVEDEPRLMPAFRKLLHEVIEVANTMQHFLMPLMNAMLVKHFGLILKRHSGTTINNAPNFYEFWIPFFSEPPKP